MKTWYIRNQQLQQQTWYIRKLQLLYTHFQHDTHRNKTNHVRDAYVCNCAHARGNKETHERGRGIRLAKVKHLHFSRPFTSMTSKLAGDFSTTQLSEIGGHRGSPSFSLYLSLSLSRYGSTVSFRLPLGANTGPD